ncbi:MAG TPA: molybdopterin-binding protein [Candidatus Limnocylindrales bacterium]|nr:molybdopterin-binding protein [Candidatus Limnocylindrales bacterium]
MPESSVIAVGNELLRGFTQDTNSSWLAARLFARGYPVRQITIVGDVDDDIVAEVRAQIARAELDRIFVCGGLGPTPDDRTYGALALALRQPLHYDRPTGALMQGLMFSRGVAARRGTAELNAGNRRMATIPDGARVLRNGPGMAPGLVFEIGADRYLFALPGPPHELQSIVEHLIEPRYLKGGIAPTVIELHYRLAPESAFHDVMRRLETEYPDVSLGSYPQSQLGRLVIRASGEDPDRVARAIAAIRAGIPGYTPEPGG